MAVVLAIFVALGIVYILSSQLSMFSETYLQLKKKFNTTSNELVQWASKTFNIQEWKINAWTNEAQSEAISNSAIAEKLTEAWRMW